MRRQLVEVDPPVLLHSTRSIEVRNSLVRVDGHQHGADVGLNGQKETWSEGHTDCTHHTH